MIVVDRFQVLARVIHHMSFKSYFTFRNPVRELEIVKGFELFGGANLLLLAPRQRLKHLRPLFGIPLLPVRKFLFRRTGLLETGVRAFVLLRA